MASKEEALWLIKSQSRILGPYTFDEVAQLLEKREVVALDEISTPTKMWRYIRDVEAYSKVIEELHINSLKQEENTEITHINDKTVDMTVSLTEPLSYQKTTETINMQGAGSREAHANTYDSDEQIKVYGDTSTNQIELQAQRFQKNLWISTFIICLLVGAGVYLKYNYFSSHNNKLTFKDYRDRAFVDYQVGHYQQSLEQFKQAHALNQKDDSIYFTYGALLIQVANQSVLGRRFIDDYRQQNIDKPTEVSNILGVASLAEGDLPTAVDYFHKALASDPEFIPAKVNLGSANIQSREYNKAIEVLSQVIKNQLASAEPYIMFAEANIFLWHDQQKEIFLKNSLFALEKYLSQSFDFRQEIQLAYFYLSFLLSGKDNNYEKMILSILDNDPEQTRLHRHNIFIDQHRVRWQSLSRWCLQLGQELEGSAYLKAMTGLCLAQSGNLDKALTQIKEALAQEPKNALLLALSAYILDRKGRDQEASVTLGHASKVNRGLKFALPSILQARFCFEQKNYECAQKTWQSLLQNENHLLLANTGLAQVYFAKGQFSQARDFYKKASRYSQNYIPLLELNQSLRNIP